MPPTLQILPYFYRKSPENNSPLNMEYGNGAYSHGERSLYSLPSYVLTMQPFDRSSQVTLLLIHLQQQHMHSMGVGLHVHRSGAVRVVR